jgi:hypothetical protein
MITPNVQLAALAETQEPSCEDPRGHLERAPKAWLLVLTLTEPNSLVDKFGATIDRLPQALGAPTKTPPAGPGDAALVREPRPPGRGCQAKSRFCC